MSDRLRTDRYAIAMPGKTHQNKSLVTWAKSEIIVWIRTPAVQKWEPTVPMLGQLAGSV